MWRVAGGRLERVVPERIELPGGASLREGSAASGGAVLEVRDARGALLATSAYPRRFIIVARGRLLVTAGAVVDLLTGRRWPKPHGLSWDADQSAMSGACMPAGVRGDGIVAACAFFRRQGDFTLIVPTLVGHDGSRTPLAPGFHYAGGFGARAAALSPDGRRLGARLEVGCGGPYSIVERIPWGAPGRYLTGEEGGAGRFPKVTSDFLGWTADGRVVGYLFDGSCEGDFTDGVYLIDPVTFARTLVVRGYGALWGTGAA